MRRALFRRHSSPWSAWTRWATTPLVLVPVWRRSWRDAGLVAVWFALNPVIFREPADRSAWSTRAMLGEEQWIVDRPKDAATVVTVAASVSAVAAIVAARRRWLIAAIAATAVQMALTLVYWRQMGRYFDRTRMTR